MSTADPTPKTMTIAQELPVSDAVPAKAGKVLFDGHCYDRRLRRCRIYAVADGEGAMEWRVARESFGGDEDSAVERCFRSYEEALRWVS